MAGQFKIRLGKNIRKYRNEANMTLKELADKVGLSESTIQKYEAGDIKRIDVELLKKLSDALNVPPESLTEWEKEEYQKYREPGQGAQEAKIIKMYNQLTFGHKKAVCSLMENLLECQEKYNSDK